MMSLRQLRSRAFERQHGLCFYCGLPMWLTSSDEITCLGVPSGAATPMQCTAEHLIARKDGGRDTSDNIVAACVLCNTRRHQRKTPPAPHTHQERVRKRVAKGKWHPPEILRMKSALGSFRQIDVSMRLSVGPLP